MDNSKQKLTEEMKMMEEMQSFLDEVNSDPEVANLAAPPEMKQKIFEKIAFKTATPPAQSLTAEEQELIRLGKIYQKRRKSRKYLILAAAVICAMAFGITSMGGPERIYERVKSALVGREQVNVDSKEIEPIKNMSEEVAYQQIEDEFGFYPVGLGYLPEGVVFLDAEVRDKVHGASIIYGKDDEAKIVYYVRPNYRVSSVGEDVEDELLEEKVVENEYTTVYARNYRVAEGEERWIIQFEYCDISYFLQIYDTSKEEVMQIIDNLYFS